MFGAKVVWPAQLVRRTAVRIEESGSEMKHRDMTLPLNANIAWLVMDRQLKLGRLITGWDA